LTSTPCLFWVKIAGLSVPGRNLGRDSYKIPQRKAMKRNKKLNIILILLGLFLTSNAISHPYDEPLTFKLHTTKDGRSIYTNIPKKCFSNGVLTCTGLHPLFGTPEKNSKIESKPIKKPAVKEGGSPLDPLPDPPPIKLSESATGPEFKLSTTKRKCYRRGTANYRQTSLFTSHATLEECNEARNNLSKSRSDNQSAELSESSSGPEFKLSTTKRECYRRGTANYRQTSLFTSHATLEECNEARNNLSKSRSDNQSVELSESSSGPEFKLSTTKRKCYRRGTTNYRQTSLFTSHATLEECNGARSNLSKSRSDKQSTELSESSNVPTY
jgi:hypothetical protein